MSVLTKESLAEAEVILNRTNLALARSRKLIESWMSTPKPTDVPADDNDEDFKAESELAGLGTTVVDQESDLRVSSVTKKRYAGNEKLLEQILGKKGAKEHLKSKALATDTTGPTKSTPQKNVVASTKSQQKDVSDNEEESRTKTVGKGRVKTQRPIASDAKLQDHNGGLDSADTTVPATESNIPDNRRVQPPKRRATSYLDELLSDKSKRKRK